MVICASDTIVEPGAMMIEFFDTFVALPTMLRLIIYNRITNITKILIFVTIFEDLFIIS